MDDRKREEIRRRLARMGKSRHQIRQELKRQTEIDQKQRRVVREMAEDVLEKAEKLNEGPLGNAPANHRSPEAKANFAKHVMARRAANKAARARGFKNDKERHPPERDEVDHQTAKFDHNQDHRKNS